MRIWSRVRRRTMAPRRPAVFPEQWALVLVTALAVGAGLVVAILLLAGR